MPGLRGTEIATKVAYALLRGSSPNLSKKVYYLPRVWCLVKVQFEAKATLSFIASLWVKYKNVRIKEPKYSPPPLEPTNLITNCFLLEDLAQLSLKLSEVISQFEMHWDQNISFDFAEHSRCMLAVHSDLNWRSTQVSKVWRMRIAQIRHSRLDVVSVSNPFELLNIDRVASKANRAGQNVSAVSEVFYGDNESAVVFDGSVSRGNNCS